MGHRLKYCYHYASNGVHFESLVQPCRIQTHICTILSGVHLPVMENLSSLIPTKLIMPQSSGDLIERSRLIERMLLGLRRKVTIISAPAGFGKTTLAISCLKSQSTPVAWFSISEMDNDLNHFLNYLVASLQTVFPNSFQNSQSLLKASLQSSIDFFVTTLINDISAIPSSPSETGGPSEPGLILVLDDYHLIENQDIHRLISGLIEYQPEQIHLVLIGRQDPFQLPISQLRARGNMTEIRQADIRFNLAETQRFMEQELATDVPKEIVEVVDERIEGWAVGLRLTTLTLHDLDDPALILQGLKGTHRYVTEYLIDEVLSRQPPAIKAFMLKTSILQRLSAPLCNHLIGDDDPNFAGLDYLEWLETTNLFVISLDDQREWYRYHHLFQELLRGKLRDAYPESEIKALHCQASHWFIAEGYLEEAIQHALAADDIELAAKIVESNSQNLLNRWERQILEGWISLLPEVVVWDRPRLLLVNAWLLYRQWRLKELESVLDRIENLIDIANGSMVQDDVRPISGQVLALKCATRYLVHNDFQGALVLSEEALIRLPQQATGARSSAIAFGALSSLALGQQAEAIDRLRMVISDSAPLGPAKVQAFIFLAHIHLQAVDFLQMQQISEQSLAWAKKTREANAVQGAHYVAGILNYEQDKLLTAENHFKKVIDLRYRANFNGAVNAGLYLVRIYLINDQNMHAQELIDKLREATLGINNTDLLPGLEAAQAELWLHQKNILAAKRWAQAFQKEVTADKVLKFESPMLNQARILLSHGSEAEIQAVRRRLEQELHYLETYNFTYRAIQTLAHLALVYDHLRMGDEALDTLQRAITLAQPGGLIRTFVDCGSGLVPLLNRLAATKGDKDYILQLLASFEPGQASGNHIVDDSIDLLTRREYEVLQLLAEGMTNQEIADKLFISLNTIKRHNANIYGKLAVNNRREALRKARLLNYIL